MESKKEHLEIMEKKSRISREKYEFQMLGQGIFSDFDNIMKKKRVKEIKEGKIET